MLGYGNCYTNRKTQIEQVGIKDWTRNQILLFLAHVRNSDFFCFWCISQAFQNCRVGPPWGRTWSSGGPQMFVWETYLFWTKWAQFASLKYFTYHIVVSVLTPNYKQHFFLPAKIRKVCYSFAELYVKSVYFHLYGWRGREFNETFQAWRKV
jgi:hypothetical protein